LYALAEAAKELLWLTGLLSELKLIFGVPVLYVDNQGAIALAKNPVAHQRSKHIEIRWFFVRDIINSNKLKLNYIPTESNRADILTKATSQQILARHVCELLVDLNHGGALE
jgi:hypothetical protein